MSRRGRSPSQWSSGRFQFNQYGGERCQRYHVNKDRFETFSRTTRLISSTNIVLQHNRPENSKRFIEIHPHHKPGGMLVFKFPVRCKVPQTVGGSPLEYRARSKAELTDMDAANERELVGEPSVTLAGRVKNLSSVMVAGGLTRKFPVRLGNHWHVEGRMIVNDDARADLPTDLQPGES